MGGIWHECSWSKSRYRPELKRSFSRLETFGVAFSIM